MGTEIGEGWLPFLGTQKSCNIYVPNQKIPKLCKCFAVGFLRVGTIASFFLKYGSKHHLLLFKKSRSTVDGSELQ